MLHAAALLCVGSALQRAPGPSARRCVAVLSSAARAPDLWRLAGVSVPYDEAAFGVNEKTGAPEPWWKDESAAGVSEVLRKAIATTLNVGVELLERPEAVTIVRRSLDARPPASRRRNDKGSGGADAFDERPRYAYIVDLELPAGARVRKSDQLVRREAALAPAPTSPEPGAPSGDGGGVVVVGAGPAGLFAALTLVDAGVRDITIIERGQPVERRGGDIGRLIHRRELLADSNFCYGEGGAGTWSDGKLTTRIGRNSAAVRLVLERLVQHGAPARILVDGKPHLGTDRLVKILQDMRRALLAAGVTFRWGAKVEGLLVQGGRAAGVRLAAGGEELRAASVVLAVGHSARELLGELRAAGVPLAPKPFAVGFRIEHPQEMINAAQLGPFAGAVGEGALPAADYRLTWQPPRAALGSGAAPSAPEVGDAFSFCMCPGGQIVPTATHEDQLCVNGMSFSRRQSKWANSAVVTQVTAAALRPYEAQHGPLAGLALQEDIERAAAAMGGGGLVAPVQLASDFIAGRLSDPASLPPSSYRLGVKSARLDLIYPEPLTRSLQAALAAWERRMPGFASHPSALLHGVETRTSCPVQIDRDRATLQCPGLGGVYPTGEGAGWAGGIVSAAVDGVRVGRALALASGVPPGALRGLAAATEDEGGAEQQPQRGEVTASGGKLRPAAQRRGTGQSGRGRRDGKVQAAVGSRGAPEQAARLLAAIKV